jgi:hypothetical protein
MKIRILLLICVASLNLIPLEARRLRDRPNDLKKMYEFYCTQESDIKDHVPVLRNLARECSSVVEIGLRSMVSSWGILMGLADSSACSKSYLGIDISYPPEDKLRLASHLSERNGCYILSPYIRIVI